LFDSRELFLENGEKIFDVGKLSLGETVWTLKGKEGNGELTNMVLPVS
jgi:hypothetical protein